MGADCENVSGHRASAFGFALIKAFVRTWHGATPRRSKGWEWCSGLHLPYWLCCTKCCTPLHTCWLGQENFRSGWTWRNSCFVQADRQVLNYKRFMIVALAPAVVVATVSLAGAIFGLRTATVLFFHGPVRTSRIILRWDFGLLCFSKTGKEDEIYTFDVKSEGNVFIREKLQPLLAPTPWRGILEGLYLRKRIYWWVKTQFIFQNILILNSPRYWGPTF